MELCHGGDLFDRLMVLEHMDEPTVGAIARSMSLSLLHCHHLGIMHRDIKPENVLMLSKADDTLIKLTDFGVSIFFEPGKPCLERAGTPEYMAPEVLQQCYGPEADWWSLGVMLYVLLSGTLPFFESPKLSLQDRILTKPPNFRYTPIAGADVKPRADHAAAAAEVLLQDVWPRTHSGRDVCVHCRTARWAEVSVEAKDFISRLLCKDPSQRLCGEAILGE